MSKQKPNQFTLPSGQVITELPILFQTDMVKAILEDRKTQTRRTTGLNKYPDFNWKPIHRVNGVNIKAAFADLDDKHILLRSHYGQPGDLLWVREKFTPLPWDMVNSLSGLHFSYFAGLDADSLETAKEYGFKWKPSIHMPKAASRIWLMIEDVRVERVQEISEEDARAEGIEPKLKTSNPNFSRYKNYQDINGLSVLPKESFQSLWVSINGEASWHSNPWVWVVKFRVLSKTGKPSMEQIDDEYQDITANCQLSTGKEASNV